MSLAAFYELAFQSGAFQEEAATAAWAFQKCAFQADAFQADVCQEPIPVIPPTIPGGHLNFLTPAQAYAERKAPKRRAGEFGGSLARALVTGGGGGVEFPYEFPKNVRTKDGKRVPRKLRNKIKTLVRNEESAFADAKDSRTSEASRPWYLEKINVPDEVRQSLLEEEKSRKVLDDIVAKTQHLLATKDSIGGYTATEIDEQAYYDDLALRILLLES